LELSWLVWSLKVICFQLLKSLLDKTARELDAQREQTEVLKLQVLASKRAEWVVRTDKRATAARPRTRDLIRRDKEAYRLKLFKIEGMEAEELQEMVKVGLLCLLKLVDELNSPRGFAGHLRQAGP
jgi:hypothetical protein